MSANDFGLTADSVRRHYFPNHDEWSSKSRPSTTTVAEIISEEAAHMAGALALELVDASAITTDSAAYKACLRILRLQVAAKLARIIPGVDSDLAQRWDESIATWYEKLDEGGASLLGDGASATGTSDADGPTSHVSVYGLNSDVGADMSDPVAGKLRMDDEM